MNDLRVKSHIEEAFALFYLIAGLLAHGLGWQVFAWCLFGMAAYDFVAACIFGVLDNHKNRGKQCPPSA